MWLLKYSGNFVCTTKGCLAYVTVSYVAVAAHMYKGDLLGPSVNGLDKLIKMPYGCGEQNMLNFAPNIYIMKYLEIAGQMTADIADKSRRYMMAGMLLCRLFGYNRMTS